MLSVKRTEHFPFVFIFSLPQSTKKIKRKSNLFSNAAGRTNKIEGVMSPMPKDVMYGKTLRKSFARIPEEQEMPHLLEIQKNSYKWFLEQGLKDVFSEVDSVTD